MPLVVWFSRLQPGTDTAVYARFARDVDYPAASRVPSIIRYRSHRIQGPCLGDAEPDYDYVETAEITDIEAYRKDLEQHPAVQEVHGAFEQYVRSVGNFRCDVLDDPSLPQKGGEWMSVVFWFSRLQPGVDPAEYEKWVREVDYVAAKQIASLIRYRVHRINGPCLGDTAAPYDYVEIAEVTDIDDYRRDLEQHPAAHAIGAEIGKYVQSVGNAWGVPLEE